MERIDVVLKEFFHLAPIPRPSHHEERVSEYLYQWAKDHGLAVEKDTMNEIIIDKPASLGCEQAPRVILQAHMDMVCVCEEGIKYDPLYDPIKVIYDGVTLRAEGTSLGADNGILLSTTRGCCTTWAMSSEIIHRISRRPQAFRLTTSACSACGKRKWPWDTSGMTTRNSRVTT